MRIRAKTQRLWLVVGAMVALGGAGALAFSTLGDKATYFYAPSDLAGIPAPTSAIRLGGMVEKGSLVRNGQTVTFVVTDNARTLPVTYTGILPDLFREGQGVIAEGKIDPASGMFTAETILAKHDEKYMPPEVTGAMRKTEGRVS
ncbi:cytochrome c-type biogenesis protein CcmE [Polymorphobacter fuscus]|uniref:Cytochrome c-type biogenesis protein CcmE n=1 Tax=Sandarakinorhabdus fusca TaxID=1439888 RepID=A0A7C9GWA9_9SPHN|nr:cytochrome c maturation protein CcmE [Polymorphobacter fuscus]KAB7645429.1 cytochrome c maturation protein CcmE [Polymorphobacter fuscus]MQT17849.1 cytochrome c maturation protein CcmE [Polymorphobacter fuscus]NJC08478.1 cytochrome c-type biogenesis protein CcmE [Polymorphobacter fuscus]